MEWLAELLRWPPLDSPAGRAVVGGALVFLGLAGAIVAVRLRDEERIEPSATPAPSPQVEASAPPAPAGGFWARVRRVFGGE